MNALERPTTPERVWPIAGGATLVLLLLLATVGGEGPFAVLVPSFLALGALAVAAWAIRQARRNRAGYETRLTGWAAAQAVLDERLRIARDLHDLVSHGLGLITVRAAATRHLAVTGSECACPEMREALTDIETASRHATAELRRMLTVLRCPDDDGAPRVPMESLDQLPGLVRGAGIAGLRTRLVLGEVGEVSQGVQVAVCKTVREALSNSARHAGPTDVEVRVGREGDTLVVVIDDSGPDGPWPTAPGAGYGLAGLRERISALGGSLWAEDTESGYRITAHLPDRDPA